MPKDQGQKGEGASHPTITQKDIEPSAKTGAPIETSVSKPPVRK